MREESGKKREVDKDASKEKIPPAPEGWKTNRAVAQDLGVGKWTISSIAEKYRGSNPEWFGVYADARNRLLEHCAPGLIAIMQKEINTREPAPEGWKTNRAVAQDLGVGKLTVSSIAEKYRGSNPEWFGVYADARNHLLEHYAPELIAIMQKEINTREPAPEGWKTNGAVAQNLGVDQKTISSIAEKYRGSNPEWFGVYAGIRNRLLEHYAPELCKKIEEEVGLRQRAAQEAKERNRLKEDLERLAEDVRDESSEISQQFRALVNVFGSSRYIDILFALRPEYKGLPVDHIKGVMAKFVGDFLMKKGKFNLRGVEMAVKAGCMSELNSREGLYEVMKDECLKYFYARKRENKEVDCEDVIYQYLSGIVEELEKMGVQSNDVNGVVQKVVSYYKSVLKDFKKPECFVDKLEKGREFPDINQKINMKELADKKRLLIADEMGLGKSASIIMAKEQLGVRCALIVAPSNVVETWQRYLSDNGERGGYYKTGEAPRVLVVDSIDSLHGVTAADYDYVIISQERMNKRYSTALADIDYDMMIVDEVHKMKQVAGVRTEHMMKLAGKIEGDDKYLAMLSGTPVPNKVQDVAVVLKLLYPERFQGVDDTKLVQQIIHGDIINLRGLLLPHMQMKSLEEGVEMPELTEDVVKVELSSLEKEVYEVLIDDDELTPTEKMRVLRQFLLNPELLDSTPNIESTKIDEVARQVVDAFQTNNRVVLFVNDYIENVIRGDYSILNKFGLSEDIEVRVVHGNIDKEDRQGIQDEFRGYDDKKILLVVSGQTADVGVDYSAGQRVLFYNDPWTEYQRRQELSRVYRPGLKNPLHSTTFVTNGTIEDGIHQYILRKYQAVEKLLNGVPISEAEQAMLEREEDVPDPSLEINRELAEYYFSSWDRMMQIFGYVKEIGEERFGEFLQTWGESYADAYVDLGNRSYQANANRVCGTIIHEFVKERGVDPAELRILDIASGPEMLKKHIGNEYQNQVVSLDINQEHFKQGSGKRVVGSMKKLPFAERSFDYANMSLSWHYTDFAPSEGRSERIDVLLEANRVLKQGGRIVLNIVYNYGLDDMEKFRQSIGHLGFRVVDEYTGKVEEGGKYLSHLITLEKIRDMVGEDESAAEVTKSIVETVGKENRDGFRFKKTKKGLKDSRRVIDRFEMNGKEIGVHLNDEDTALLEEEAKTLAEAEGLKAKYGGIAKIPANEIIDNGLVRIFIGNKYVLFKKLEGGTGVVVVK